MAKWTRNSIKKKMVVGEIEESYSLFERLLTQEISKPVREFIFHPVRKWRIDFSYPDIKLAIEVEGGVWDNGGHTRGSGFVGDMEKYNSMAELGWRLLRYTPQDLTKSTTIDQIKSCHIELAKY